MNNIINSKCGRLDMIIGPMFSGKSSELIKRINLFKVLNKTILVIKPTIDNRYSENSISTHDKITYKSINVNLLKDIKEKYLDDYKNADVLIIEESQFLIDLYEFVKEAVDIDIKHIVVAGLSGDSNRESIGSILKLIPFADTIEHKKALCTLCCDGTSASFTFKKIKDDKQVLIGGDDVYMPLCRYHYNYESNKN